CGGVGVTAGQPRAQLFSSHETERVLRFVAFDGPLLEACAAETLIEIERARERERGPGYRVCPVPRADLLPQGRGRGEPGIAQPSFEGMESPVVPAARRREGGNWGGRYLRAPDLFLELWERSGDRICRLEDLAEVRFGIKTGHNGFFYLADITADASPDLRVRHGVTEASGLRLCRNGLGHVFPLEALFLQPALRSPRGLPGPGLRREILSDCLFTCDADPEALAGSCALAYIRWGESRGIHQRPSVRGRPRWFVVPKVPPPPVIHPLIVYERACAAVNPLGIPCDANLVGIYPRAPGLHVPLAACLVSSLGVLARELAGIANLGEGALKTNPHYLKRMLVPDLRRAPTEALSRLGAAFDGVRRLPFPSLARGEPDVPWRALDDAVLSLLAPHAPGAAALREATRRLILARRAKAASRRDAGAWA
ncbi:MAG: hypothetical protein HY321_05190, partial [Armatimonadetes bacterium]|nr:hypothetical protein [Armatimonadota bacterium]